MAEKAPKAQSDGRRYFPQWVRGVPKLRTVDIVRWLYDHSPERFTANAIADKYGITRGESYRRVQYMVILGLVRRLGYAEAHRAGRKEIVYCITEWGRKYASTDQAKAKGPKPKRAAANPKD